MSTSLAGTLEDYAAWVGAMEPHGALWVERLAANTAELETIRTLPHSDSPAYVAQPARLAGPEGEMPPATLAIPPPSGPATALERAREANPRLKAFSFIAGAADPSAPGYLRDIPFAVKDMIAVAGMPLTAGSASSDDAPVAVDAACVSALKRHGAVAIGMANQHELALGATSSNPVYGAVLNPVAPERIPGGSSGGSAACVAAGLVPFALGTDTGGSIRLPAACCGVVGFKPSYDAVSRAGVIDVAPSLDHVGPIGRCVRDCALAFAGMLDMPAEPRWTRASLEGVRVGRLGGFFEDPIDVEVLAGVGEACAALAADGAAVSPASFEEARKAAALYFVTALSEAAVSHGERLRLHADRIGDDVRSRLETAHFIPAHWYVKAQRHRTGLARAGDALFDRFDILLSATMRAPAPQRGATAVEIGGASYPLHAAMTQLTIPFSLTGAPALSLPWSKTHGGVPICLQLVARQGDDWKLLAVAARLEELSPRQ